MDRDTLQDDLDLILAPSRDAQLPGEWDWEPPLGTVVTVAELGHGADGAGGDRDGGRLRGWGRRRRGRRGRLSFPRSRRGRSPAAPSGSNERPPQAARTESTGARSRATTRHVAPASDDPNSSPDVAPNHRPSGVASSRANAWRRIVR